MLNNKLKLSLIAIATLVATNSNAQSYYSCIPEECPAGQYFNGRRCLPLPTSEVSKASCSYTFSTTTSDYCDSYRASGAADKVTSSKGVTYYPVGGCVRQLRFSGAGGSSGTCNLCAQYDYVVLLKHGDSITGKTCDDGVLK